MSDPKLSARNVRVAFGGVAAVDDVTIDVYPGEVVGLMGPNGAGKTTLFEILSGFLRPNEGRVFVDGIDVTDMPVHERARLGVARGFQDARLYPSMTVDDVLRVALDRHLSGRVDLVGMVLGLPSARRAERWVAERADALVDRFGLGRYRDTRVSALSTGTRRVVEIATVMAQEPTVVLFDEPTAGVAQAESEALRRLLKRLCAETRLTVVLIEHDVPMVVDLSHRVYVMDAGRLLAEGRPEEVVRDPAVIEAYFGTRAPIGGGVAGG